MSIVILLIGIVAIALGYFVYAKRIDRDIVQPDDKKATPAKMYMDGVDFTPANRNVLFGYQFKSVAALGPIVGPIVAVRWGWLPARWLRRFPAPPRYWQSHPPSPPAYRQGGLPAAGLFSWLPFLPPQGCLRWRFWALARRC